MSESDSYFEREKGRLTSEITNSFEELLTTTNTFNRQTEEVLIVGRGYDAVASLWTTFRQLAQGPTTVDASGQEEVVDTTITKGNEQEEPTTP